MGRTGQLFETINRRGMFNWECTCGLKGNIYFPNEQGAIEDGSGHQCNVGWPASNRRATYVGCTVR